MPPAEDAAPAFGLLLREHRLEAGLTQEALAERAGLSRRGIQHLEADEARPYRDTVRRLAQALGLAPEARAAFEAAARRRPRRRGEGRLPGVQRPELAGEAARAADAAATAADQAAHSAAASPLLVQQAPAPDGTPETERKLVTVLCAEVSGATVPLESLDPEAAHVLLRGVRQTLIGAIQQYGGIVNQVLGGGLTALFGAPLAQEDHALRACYAALALQEAVRRYGEEARPDGITLRLRVGLCSGEVVVPAVAGDASTAHPAVGRAVHLATRIAQLAPADACLLTPETLRLVEGRVRVRPLGALAGDGLTEPIEAYRLVGVEPSLARLPGAAARGLTPLVGRRTELEALQRALEQAGRGRGQIVALFGEPGVGKSRLVWEVAHARRGHGSSHDPASRAWTVLAAGAVSYGTATPYLPVIDLLRAYCRIEARDDSRAAREKLTGTLLGLDRALEPSLPPLLALLDLPPDEPTVEDGLRGSPWEALDPVQRRRLTLDALKRLLVRESRARPLLLIFEDLHWIDSETQALLDGLVDGLPTAAILLLVTYRPEYTHTWGSRTYYAQLRVDPLPPESAHGLLGSLLGDDPSVADLKPLLVERTEGNPFFLEESVRALVESGALVGERGAYRLARPDAPVAVPPTVQAILAARIDRLAPEDKRLLQTAAVIGTDVPFALLEAVAGLGEDELRRGLARLQGAELLYEASLLPEPEYTFKHALTHEVAYGNLLREWRRALHARIVDALEAEYPERLDERVEQLAHHAIAGERWEAAVEYARQAGANAKGRSANREAVTWLEQALAALEHLPETRDRLEQGIDLRIDLRQALSPLGEILQALDRLREAEAMAERLGDRHRLSWISALMTFLLWRVGEPERAIGTGRRALAIAEALGELAPRVVASYHLGLLYREVGEHRQAIEALEWTAAALQGDLVRERFGLGDYPAVGARGGLAWFLAELGEFTRGIAHGEEAIRIAEAIGHPYSLGIAYFDLGGLYLRRGDLPKAMAILERGLGLSQDLDLPGLFPAVASRLGAAYTLAGRMAEGLVLLERVERRVTSTGEGVEGSLESVWLGEAYLLDGRVGEAFQLAERSFQQSIEHRRPVSRAWALRLLGEIAAQRDPPDPNEAEARYREALVLAEELGMRPLQAHCHLGLGALYWRVGQEEQARAELATAAELYRAMEMPFWLEQAEAALTQIAE